jgi:hypothetical protein
MDLATIISNGLTIVSNKGLPLLTALAAVGVLSMAVQEVVKDLIPIRAWFHKRKLERWIGQRASGKDQAVKDLLLMLATGGNESALYELPVTGMMGQITMASRVALASPLQFEPLLRALAGAQVGCDVNTIVQAARDEEARAESRRLGAERPLDPVANDSERQRREQAQIDVEQARIRVGNLVERNIDALQISVSSRWEYWNKVAAFVLSWVVTDVALWLYLYSTNINMSIFDRPLLETTIAAGVIGGFVAPIAKDLVAALQRLRGGR